jgi:hypothetical protein
MSPNFLCITWCGEASRGLGVQDVESLMEEGEDKEGKKKQRRKEIAMGREGFPMAEPTLLAMQQLASILDSFLCAYFLMNFFLPTVYSRQCRPTSLCRARILSLVAKIETSDL